MNNAKGTISIDDIDIITEMSDSAKAKVYLASVKGTAQLVVYKELEDKGNMSLYKRIKDMPHGEKGACFPRIYAVWEENGKIALIEEYISGGTLEEKLQKGFRFSENELTDYMIQLSSALRRLHEVNPPIIHRDLKPDNIIITESGELRLLDFDAAREYDKSLSHDTVILGTKEYAPPEQYGFAQTDVRSDIYSFGKVFDELLGNTDASDSYIQRCKKIIDKATMFDPDNRYADTGMLLRELYMLRKPLADRRKVLLPVLLIALVMFGGVIGLVISSLKNNMIAKETYLHSDMTTTLQDMSGQEAENMRFKLSYGVGTVEYYEDYEGVLSRICGLNNSEYEYTITYIGDDEAYKNGIYNIRALPPVAGKITFTVENKSGIKNCKLKMSNIAVTYPVISCMHIAMNGCSFDNLTMDGRIGGYISLSEDNTFGSVILRNGAYLATHGDTTISKLVIEDNSSFLCFNDGIFYIKELVSCDGNVGMHINRGYDNYERQLIITDEDISMEQFLFLYETAEDYTLDIEKNEKEQNVLSLVKKETADSETEQTPKIMRYELSYRTGISEYYEYYEDAYNRMCELNNPEYEYVVTYIGDSNTESAVNYKIASLPPVAGKITFSVGENVNVKKSVFQLNKLTASYPVVVCSNVRVTDCSFENFTLDGLYGMGTTLCGENTFGNVVLKKNVNFCVMEGGSATVSRLEMEDGQSSLGFGAGMFYIKELVGYKGTIRMYINFGYDNYERQLIVTDTDILKKQFLVNYSTSEEFTLAIDKNESGQNVLSLVPRE